jgi:hypothetical protein
MLDLNPATTRARVAPSLPLVHTKAWLPGLVRKRPPGVQNLLRACRFRRLMAPPRSVPIHPGRAHRLSGRNGVLLRAPGSHGCDSTGCTPVRAHWFSANLECASTTSRSTWMIHDARDPRRQRWKPEGSAAAWRIPKRTSHGLKAPGLERYGNKFVGQPRLEMAVRAVATDWSILPNSR